MHVMLDAMVGTGFETEGCDAEYADVLAMIPCGIWHSGEVHPPASPHRPSDKGEDPVGIQEHLA